MTRKAIILNSFYCLVVVFFLLDRLRVLEIKSQTLKSFIYFSFLVATPFVLLWNTLLVKIGRPQILAAVFAAIMLVIILIVGPMMFLFSVGAWRTQMILYQHKHLSFRAVEFQMQDVGALGYKKREVEVFYLTPFFMITRKAPGSIESKLVWVKVDKDVNELGLKYP